MDNKEKLLTDLAKILVEEMRQQLRIAGHTMTGDLVESVEGRVESTLTGAKVEILLNTYGLYLDKGVPPERIPFTEPSGRGGRSLYIEGLQRFAQLKLGVTDNRESLGIAFAIARKHKQVGLPTRGPTNFIDKTVRATDDELQDFIEQWAADIFEAQLNISF